MARGFTNISRKLLDKELLLSDREMRFAPQRRPAKIVFQSIQNLIFQLGGPERAA